jgi:hypothetical protein
MRQVKCVTVCCKVVSNICESWTWTWHPSGDQNFSIAPRITGPLKRYTSFSYNASLQNMSSVLNWSWPPMRVEKCLHKLRSCVNGDKNFVAGKLQRYTKHNGTSHSETVHSPMPTVPTRWSSFLSTIAFPFSCFCFTHLVIFIIINISRKKNIFRPQKHI